MYRSIYSFSSFSSFWFFCFSFLFSFIILIFSRVFRCFSLMYPIIFEMVSLDMKTFSCYSKFKYIHPNEMRLKKLPKFYMGNVLQFLNEYHCRVARLPVTGVSGLRTTFLQHEKATTSLSAVLSSCFQLVTITSRFYAYLYAYPS